MLNTKDTLALFERLDTIEHAIRELVTRLDAVEEGVTAPRLVNGTVEGKIGSAQRR